MKTLILIHGRSWKPEKADLKKLWIDAIKYGFKRDRPDLLDALRSIKIEFVYYGDISNEFLSRVKNKAIPDDIADRRASFELLKQYSSNQFTKRQYNKLPGKSFLKEAIADLLSPTLRLIRLSDELINSQAPDMGEYWKGDATEYGSNVRGSMSPILKKAMDRNDSICVLAHSLGTMISYDTFWKFSYRGEYRPKYNNKKVDLFISLGSPLGDATVQSRLHGAQVKGKRRYPNNVKQWVNISAEDDYICHDERIVNDFKNMEQFGNIEDIRDIEIYNLAVRDGKSNPHNGIGYLVHPKTITEIAKWVEVSA